MSAEIPSAYRRLALAVALLIAAFQLVAQDTPEMLAAMRTHLPPVPENVPERAALPEELRREIPAVRLETHRWHVEPAQRFVIVHGRRIEEDGVIDRDLWLRRIRKDGVVLQFGNTLFFQPR
ncbi:MAG: general secretion pathway protein GspB [Lysobacteraceae bacterium]